MKQFRLLLSDIRGVAAIEFAFVSLFLFGTITVALDFGYNAQQRLKLGNAVEQAAVVAYNQQTGSDTSTISSLVIAASGIKNAPSVSVTCNGTTTCGDGQCSCITSSGGFALAATCNAKCPGSIAISGNYMKLAATATYNAVIVPDRWLGGSTIRSSAVLRLQ
jgi:Flp pilus assembly protein TadG